MERRRTDIGGASGFESAIDGTLAVDPAADWSPTSGSGTNEAVGLSDFRLMQVISAAIRPQISHQEQT
jgi:hypothetical protein